MLKRLNCLFLFSIIVVLSMTCVVNAEEKENESFKFRGYEWGTPLDDIKEKEITPGMIEGFNYETRENEKIFLVMTTVANVNLYAFFYFDDDWKLRFGMYTPQTSLIKTDIEYYSDFETIVNALTDLYGDPERFANVIDVDDIPSMSRDDIISEIVQNNAVISYMWTAKDDSVILANCFFFGGHVRGEIYYLQTYDQILELQEENDAANSEGL